MEKSIWYGGIELFFKEEVKSIDEAQSIIDGCKHFGKQAASLHENNKHQVYCQRSMKKK
ncbi:MAG: hypothetical protein WC934_04840 [Acidithiobacillus sp.]|jgi:hypothetical protein|uniref:hypothetical protein n=1 Tax=Acidithiobacillus sp. TaxID=1872118 RepID=UPI00355F7A5A